MADGTGITPKRIQLRRTKGWRKPEGAIVVARPSKHGNPYWVGSWATVHGHLNGQTYEQDIEVTPAIAVEAFRLDWETRLDTFGSTDPEDVEYVAARRAELETLRGHDLACWCPLDQPCHADVLLELANQEANR